LNGEIYNSKELYKYLNISPSTDANCEIIIHLYKRFGIEHTLQLLDGDFAFILMESDLTYDMHKIIIARDPYGVRPLYVMSHKNPLPFKEFERETIVGIASEIKMLTGFCDELNFPAYLNHEPEALHKPKKISQNTIETQTDPVVTSEPEPEKKKRGRKPIKKTDVDMPKESSSTSPVPPSKSEPKIQVFNKKDEFGEELTSINGIIREDVNCPQVQYRVKDPAPFPDEYADYLENDLNYDISAFKAGTYSEYYLSINQCIPYWKLVHDQVRYHSTGFNSIMYHLSPQYNELEIVQNIQRFLIRSIEKRCSTAEKPMACLLSGGLDSSVITGLVCQYHKTHGLPQLETYCIGLEGGEDLKYAKMVAEHLGTKHTEIILKESDFTSVIPEVIGVVESYDTMTVRNAICNYLAGKYIAEHSKAKVIFNGDGADELMGGYLYMYLAADSLEFDKECRRLLKDIYLFDTMRSDKCMAAHGLETRSPYLDRSFVQYYLTIPPQIRFHTRNEQCEKYLMRVAFCAEYYRNSEDKTLLPDEVLWRTKEEFSDGVSVKENSLHDILHEYAHTKFVEDNIRQMHLLPYEDNIYREMAQIDPVMSNLYGYLGPKNAEQYLYRKEYEKLFKGVGHIIPYFWMPRYFKKVTDPSARSLPIYAGNESMLKEYESQSESEDDDDYDNENDDDNYSNGENENGNTTNSVNTNFNITFNDPNNENPNGGTPDFTFTINSDGITKTINNPNASKSGNVHEINVVLDKNHFAAMFSSILQSSADLKKQLENHLLAQGKTLNSKSASTSSTTTNTSTSTTTNKTNQNIPMCVPVSEPPKQKRGRKPKAEK
jgi:asparagine synthetase B (glutamine-hydrolysing)